MKYDPQLTWRQNLDLAPKAPNEFASAPAVPGSWAFCGLQIDSPLGIPAGPLLDARWLLYYANLGFDWLVYKTVRSGERECYDLPNLVPVEVDAILEAGSVVAEQQEMQQTWAVSFGMPSQSPDLWRRDVEFARERLPKNKVLVVSVVGTQDPTLTDSAASLEQLADDFALCARWAVESGADAVEANFSCPNVSTADGQLYQQPAAAGFVAERIREAIGQKPLVLKIGSVRDNDLGRQLLDQVGSLVDGLAMTNSIIARVQKSTGDFLFDGQPRGICGDAIRERSIEQVAMFQRLIIEQGCELDLIGVGGISNRQHVRDYLSAGAAAVGIATAAMVDPSVGFEIRRDW